LERARKSLTESERPIRALAFTPDQSSLVVADDALIQSWSVETGVALQRAASTPGIKSVAVWNDTSFAVAGDSAVVWNLRQEWSFKALIGAGDSRSPLADRVNALCFTIDGQQLFTAGGEPTRGGEIKLWRIRDGQFIRDFPNVHSDSVLALNLSADGRFLASGAADRFAKVIDLESGKVSRTLEGHTHHVLGIAWKRDGRTIITAGADNVAKAWDATTGERRKNLDGFGKEVTAAAFVGVSDEVVLAAGDGQVVRVKDKGDKVRSYAGASDYVYATAVTPDGTLVLAGGADGVLRAWSGKDGRLVAEFPNP
jgi:WD40 repeat protein